jgi:hypothetical protein
VAEKIKMAEAEKAKKAEAEKVAVRHASGWHGTKGV